MGWLQPRTMLLSMSSGLARLSPRAKERLVDHRAQDPVYDKCGPSSTTMHSFPIFVPQSSAVFRVSPEVWYALMTSRSS
jgi:hypothetical protein